jgi:hypothetical protein
MFCRDQVPAEIARPTRIAQIISHDTKQIPGMFSIFPKLCNCLHTVSAIRLGEKCVALDLHRRERTFSPILEERLTPRCASAGRRRSSRLEISGQTPLFNVTSNLLRRRLLTLRFRILCCAFFCNFDFEATGFYSGGGEKRTKRQNTPTSKLPIGIRRTFVILSYEPEESYEPQGSYEPEESRLPDRAKLGRKWLWYLLFLSLYVFVDC